MKIGDQKIAENLSIPCSVPDKKFSENKMIKVIYMWSLKLCNC